MIRSGFKWLPVIDEALCTACSLCIDACGPRSLVLDDYVAVLANPDSCGSEGHCVTVCADDAISMHWIPADGSRSVGKWLSAKW